MHGVHTSELQYQEWRTMKGALPGSVALRNVVNRSPVDYSHNQFYRGLFLNSFSVSISSHLKVHSRQSMHIRSETYHTKCIGYKTERTAQQWRQMITAKHFAQEDRGDDDTEFCQWRWQMECTMHPHWWYVILWRWQMKCTMHPHWWYIMLWSWQMECTMDHIDDGTSFFLWKSRILIDGYMEWSL